MDPFTQYLIGAGLGWLGQWWAGRQADKAAGRQIDQSQQALALEKYYFEQEQQYQQQRDQEDRRRYDDTRRDSERAYADNAPYRALGRGALSKLGLGTGISLPANFTDTRFGPQEALLDVNGNVGTPGMGGRASLSSLGQPPPDAPPTPPPGFQTQTSGLTRIKTPTGQIVMVPFSQVNDALAHGGTRV